jgi:tetratricopeptide (TPR) repeat protein
MKKNFLQSIFAIIFCSTASFAQPNISNEAQRYFDRGMAGVEMAKSLEDNALAAEEFKKAIAFAPDWPEPYYQLAIIQEKMENYGTAVINLKRYLFLAPNASNAAAVQSLINKLEYKQEQKEAVPKAFKFIGTAKFQKIISKDDKGPKKGWAWQPYFTLQNGVLKAVNVFYDTSEKSPYSDWPGTVQYNPEWVKYASVHINDHSFNYEYIYPVWGVLGNSGGIFKSEVKGKGELISTFPVRIRVVVTLKNLSFFDKDDRSVVILGDIHDVAEYVIEYSDVE